MDFDDDEPPFYDEQNAMIGEDRTFNDNIRVRHMTMVPAV